MGFAVGTCRTALLRLPGGHVGSGMLPGLTVAIRPRFLRVGMRVEKIGNTSECT